jgi:hypothetical protein
MAVFGFQILITITTTYAVDCYKPQSGYVGAWFNCIRQCVGISMSFFAFVFAEKAGYAWEFGTLAIIIAVFSLPVLALEIYGGRIRERMGKPKFDEDL